MAFSVIHLALGVVLVATWIGLCTFLQKLTLSATETCQQIRSCCKINFNPWSLMCSCTKGTDWIATLGRKRRRLLNRWFLGGIICSIVGLFASMLFLSYNLLRTWHMLASSLLDASSDVPVYDGDTVSSTYLDHASGDPYDLPALSVAIPGLTLPWSEFGYLWIAIIVGVAFHEFGHALAAAALNVRIQRVGCFVVVFFPGAYVQLDDTSVYKTLPALQKLLITSAGIWHNVVLAGICFIMSSLLALFLSPFYMDHTNRTYVESMSIAEYHMPSLTTSLHVGDWLVALDDMEVHGEGHWEAVLGDMSTQAGWYEDVDGPYYHTSYPTGRCVPRNDLETGMAAMGLNNEATLDQVEVPSCCNFTSNHIPSLQCFQFFEPASPAIYSGLELPDKGGGKYSYFETARVERSCLAAKNVITPDMQRCKRNRDCQNPDVDMMDNEPGINPNLDATWITDEVVDSAVAVDESGEATAVSAASGVSAHHRNLHGVNDEMVCAAVVFGNPAYQIIAISAMSPTDDPADDSPYFLFVGHPTELLAYVRVTSYVPRDWLVQLLPATWFPFLIALPGRLKHLLDFIVSVSVSLALINCAPVYMSDGSLSLELIVEVLWNFVWYRRVKKRDEHSTYLYDPEEGTAHQHPNVPSVSGADAQTTSWWVKCCIYACTAVLALNVIASLMLVALG